MFKYRLTIETDHFMVVSHFRSYFEMYSFLEKELNRYEELGQPNEYFPTEKPIVKSVKHEKIEMDDLYNSFINWLYDKYSKNHAFYEVDRDDCCRFMWSRDEWPYNTEVIISNLLEMIERNEGSLLYFGIE